MRSTIYVAAPYTGIESEQVQRYTQVTKYASKLMLRGHRVFSPLTHSHPIYSVAQESFDNIKDQHRFWMNQDLFWMKSCDIVHVLCLDGWEESVGVLEEVTYARDVLGIQFVYIRWW